MGRKMEIGWGRYQGSLEDDRNRLHRGTCGWHWMNLEGVPHTEVSFVRATVNEPTCMSSSPVSSWAYLASHMDAHSEVTLSGYFRPNEVAQMQNITQSPCSLAGDLPSLQP